MFNCLWVFLFLFVCLYVTPLFQTTRPPSRLQVNLFIPTFSPAHSECTGDLCARLGCMLIRCWCLLFSGVSFSCLHSSTFVPEHQTTLTSARYTSSSPDLLHAGQPLYPGWMVLGC